MKLSNEKQYELAFAALTHEFVGIREGQFPLIMLMPKNDLKVDGFYGQPLPVDPNDYKNQGTKNFMYKRYEKNLTESYIIDQTTATKHGEQFKEDYELATNRENLNIKEMFEAFKSQILVMYTTKAQNDLFKAFTKNLTLLCDAQLLDKSFVNNIVKDVFPDKDWKVSSKLDKSVVSTTKAGKVTEINA
ncbi:MAG: hypothetical protein CVV59_02285 [Tenericutes bacterium HGW-Tenericutes-4]|nr:MAG: hypothetical protein CVV59_02285 [Tenericutes bacterium HGW-Tenericutes-4]